MSTWVAVDVDLKKNNKVKALRNALKINIYEAMGHLAAFWGWCQANADETGRLCNCTDEDISEAFGWPDPTALLGALTAKDKDGKPGFLEQVGTEYKVHDWQKMQAPWYTSKKKREYDERRYFERINGTPHEIPCEKPMETSTKLHTETHAEIQPDLHTEVHSDITPEFHRHNTNNNINEISSSAQERERALAHEEAAEDEVAMVPEGDPVDECAEELMKKWKVSFGSNPTPEQLRSIITMTKMNNLITMLSAIENVAKRGITAGLVMHIANELGKACEDAKKNVFKPPGGSVLNLTNSKVKTADGRA